MVGRLGFKSKEDFILPKKRLLQVSFSKKPRKLLLPFYLVLQTIITFVLCVKMRNNKEEIKASMLSNLVVLMDKDCEILFVKVSSATFDLPLKGTYFGGN